MGNHTSRISRTVTTVVPIQGKDSTNGSLRTRSLMVYCYTHSRHRPYLSVSPRWGDKAMHSSYAAPTSKYHHEFMSMPRSIVARHPRRALTNSSSFLGRPPQTTSPSSPSDLGVQDRPVTKNDTYQQRSLDPGKTRSALSYCGGGMLSVFAVDSDDCRSSNVARASGSPDIGCSPSDSVDASDGNIENRSNYHG